MHVTVKLFATLARFKDGWPAAKPFALELPDGSLAQDLITTLKIPPGETHVIFINHTIKLPEALLNDGDVVGLFPPVGGG